MNFEFYDKKDRKVTVTISCNVGGTYKCGANALQLSENKDDDFLLPVRYWSGNLSVIGIDLSTAVMLTSSAWPVTVTRGSDVIWVGFVKCESFSCSLTDSPMEFVIPLECPISALKNKYFPFTVTDINSLTLIRNIISYAYSGYTIVENDTDRSDVVSQIIYAGEYDSEKMRWTEQPSYFDVLQRAMAPYGYRLHTRGKTAYLLRYKTRSTSTALTSLHFADSGSTFSVNRPKKTLYVEYRTDNAAMPTVTLDNCKVGGVVYEKRSTVVDGHQIVWNTYNDYTSYYNIYTYRQGGAAATNLVNRYKEDSSNWLGGAVVQDECVLPENPTYESINYTRSIILTRSMTSEDGMPTNDVLCKFKMRSPLLRHITYYLKGTTYGMTYGDVEDYRWGNNGGGWLMISVRVGSLYMDRIGGWHIEFTKLAVPVGENMRNDSVTGSSGCIGAQNSGFRINSFPISSQSTAEDLMMEIAIYGFSPSDKDNRFMKIEGISLTPKEEDEVKKDCDEISLSTAGDETYKMELDFKPGVTYDDNVVKEAKDHYKKAITVLDVNVKDDITTPVKVYTHIGKNFVPICTGIDVRESTTNIKLMEI